MIGQTVSHYRVLSQLGSGGMGVVYEAEDLKLGRRVALKFLPDTLARSPEALERLQREARAASSLQHPNICTIHDVDEHEGRPFIAMELLEGETLRDRLGPGPLRLDALLDLGIQVADALEAAHARGILHRDVKPGNIFVTRRGEAKLMDFGLAKHAETATGGENTEAATAMAEAHLTSPGSALGTVAYMSPEQARGEALDARSDVFSCGAVLYEMATGRQPFTGNTSAVIFEAILNRAPVPPVKLNPALPEELTRIVNTALEKDRDLRYQSAAELKSELKRLKRDSDSAKSGQTAAATPPSRLSGRGWRRVAAAGAILAVAAATIWWAAHRRASPPGLGAHTTLAVLPFQNLAGDPAMDHLRLALPDEVVTTLSYIPTLAIRPFATTQKYVKGEVDPQAAGREQRVADVLTGHFQKEGDQIRVTLEVVDTETNRLLWRDTSSAAASDLIGLRQQISDRLRRGLFPLLGGSAGAAEASTRPRNAEAYDLYLRSKSLTGDPEPNRQGIAMLERSVGLDPDFAPAWSALALRYYFEASYSTGRGDTRLLERSAAANARAEALDPNLTEATQGLIVFATEGGELREADAKARDLVRRRPRDPQAHFALAYVLRYAGMLDEAARECEAAISMDPRNPQFRSCFFVFQQLKDYGRAWDFLRLDAGTGWARGRESNILLRQGRVEEAVGRLREDFPEAAAMIVKSGPAPERERAAEKLESLAMGDRDPENKYYFSSFLAVGGYRERALRLLRAAVENNYLAVPAMDLDPLFDSIRNSPEFAAIRAEAVRRQKEFLAAREKSP